jgi:hypothetical protein
MSARLAAAGGSHSADATDAKPESGVIWIYHFGPDGSAAMVPNDTVDATLADHVGWT